MKSLKLSALILILGVSLGHATWGAKVMKKTLDPSKTTYTVTFKFVNSDDLANPILITDSGFQTDDQIAAYAARQLVSYQKVQTITFQDGDVIDTTTLVSPPHIPTQAELDIQAFVQLVQKYKAVKAAVAAGNVGFTQTDLDSIVAQMKTAFKPGYEVYFSGF